MEACVFHFDASEKRNHRENWWGVWEGGLFYQKSGTRCSPKSWISLDLHFQPKSRRHGQRAQGKRRQWNLRRSSGWFLQSMHQHWILTPQHSGCDFPGGPRPSREGRLGKLGLDEGSKIPPALGNLAYQATAAQPRSRGARALLQQGARALLQQKHPPTTSRRLG